MKNMNTKPTQTENVAEEKSTASAPASKTKSTGREIMKTMKHTAHVAMSDAAIIGGDIKDASKELVGAAVKRGEETCASSEKAVLVATEKVLKKASTAASNAAKSVHKSAQSK